MELNIGNYTVLIDNEDWDLLKGYKWTVVQKSSTNYVQCKVTLKGGKTYIYRMHRLIMGVDGKNWKTSIVDHINGNGLDNRKCNLRLVTPSQNMYNSKKPKNNTSGYKGVDFNKSHKKYRARIGVGTKRIELGNFDTAEAAAKAYDIAAKKYHGEFAVLNFKD